MPVDVGKVPATTLTIDGCYVTMWNRECSVATAGEIKYYSETSVSEGDEEPKATYSMVIDQSTISNHHRCLHFIRHFSQTRAGGVISASPVLYIPNVEIQEDSSGISVQPLYEVISPSLVSIGGKYDQLTWWSNVDDMSKLFLPEDVGTDDDGKLKYVSAAIKKFTREDLSELTDDGGATKILCTAPIRWEKLRTAVDGSFDITPIVSNVAVVAAIQNEGYITDFSVGTGGGSFRIHSHTSINDGGFAVGVYAPSAMIRVANWI